MTRKALAIGSMLLGSLLTLVGAISVYSFATWRPVGLSLNTAVQGDVVTIHRIGLSVPGLESLVVVFGVVCVLYCVGFLVMRNVGNSAIR